MQKRRRYGSGDWGSLFHLALMDDLVTMTLELWEFIFGCFAGRR